MRQAWSRRSRRRSWYNVRRENPRNGRGLPAAGDDMKIELTDDEVEAALQALEKRLPKYLVIQSRLRGCDVKTDADFRRAFNGFYRVRRGRAWQNAFYGLLERAKARPTTFRRTLDDLRAATGCWEASFASKLVATVDPSQPVIDSVVLRNVGIRLPPPGAADRGDRIEAAHAALAAAYAEFLPTAAGRWLVGRFRARFSNADVTETKMLDLVLWRTKPSPFSGRAE